MQYSAVSGPLRKKLFLVAEFCRSFVRNIRFRWDSFFQQERRAFAPLVPDRKGF
jgi:hypothetical protein